MQVTWTSSIVDLVEHTWDQDTKNKIRDEFRVVTKTNIMDNLWEQN